jgi:glycerol-3-phosphate O-acyltransferase
LRQLVRAMGGYFIRRRHNNPLYRKVLARYVQMATEAGVTQAVFPEGGLSRTGALGRPKLGLFSYIVDGFRPGQSRDVVFVPVAINYDRVMEDRNLIEARETGARAFRFSLWPLWRYLRRQIWYRVTGRLHRYGYAAVSFGAPLSLTAFVQNPHSDAAQDLGTELMDRIAQVMPVTPVPLVAHALAQGVRSVVALEAVLRRQIETAEAQGVVLHIPRGDIPYAIEMGLRGLMERGHITRAGDRLTVSPKGEAFVTFYAASVTHLFGDSRPDQHTQKENISLSAT